jgi:DNA-binding protein HU-beta
MNKQELITAMAKESGLSVKDASNALNAYLTTVTSALQNGEKVQLVGFGTFEVRQRADRMGKNPATGEAIQIPASKAVGFKAGQALKDAVNK